MSVADTIRRIRGVLLRRGNSAADADDLIQDAFLRLEIYRAAKPVEHPDRFLVRTALNLSIDAARRRQRSPIVDVDPETLEVVDKTPRADEVLVARERLERLEAGFAALDGKTRSMLLAQKLGGLTMAELARRHGVSVSAVEKRIARGIVFLMKWMEGA